MTEGKTGPSMMMDGIAPGIMPRQCTPPVSATQCAGNRKAWPVGGNEYASDYHRAAIHVLTVTVTHPSRISAISKAATINTSGSEVAARLGGVSDYSLYQWMKRYAKSAEQPQQDTDLQAENRR